MDSATGCCSEHCGPHRGSYGAGVLGQLIRFPFLAILALGIQILIVKFLAVPAGVLVGGLALSHLLLLVVVLANRRMWGARVLGIGLALNLIAMALNGGLMPVTPETLDRAGLSHLAAQTDLGEAVPGTKDVLLARPTVKMYLITDNLVTSFPSPRAYSAGDLIIAVGGLLFLSGVAIRAFSRRRERAEEPLA